MSALLKNATLLHLSPPRVERADVAIEDGVITAVGATLPEAGVDEVTDLAGMWLMPGLVCAHTHLYSALACGMPGPTSPITSFTNMLEQVWWRLDKALDDEGVEVSTLVGAVSALRAGVTTLVDHHASPNAIEGSLLRIDDALNGVGLRRVLCYEVTDRDGLARAQLGLDAHREILKRGPSSMSAAMIGAHANFTLSDATLRACGDLAREAGVGVHIHVAESKDDRETTGEGLVDRMRRLGALTPGSLLAHCVHLSADELAMVYDAGAWVSHQPRSNMNNGVGYAPLANFRDRTMLGTDGIGADMFAELQVGWFKAQEETVRWAPDRWLQALCSAYAFCGEKLGVTLGRIEAGAAADLVALAPCPGPRLAGDNLAAAFIFRMASNQVRHVMVAGQWRLWAGDPVGIDAIRLDARAQDSAQSIWDRMSQR
jgi:putative selenium metabolism protein SsnA